MRGRYGPRNPYPGAPKLPRNVSSEHRRSGDSSTQAAWRCSTPASLSGLLEDPRAAQFRSDSRANVLRGRESGSEDAGGAQPANMPASRRLRDPARGSSRRESLDDLLVFLTRRGLTLAWRALDLWASIDARVRAPRRQAKRAIRSDYKPADDQILGDESTFAIPTRPLGSSDVGGCPARGKGASPPRTGSAAASLAVRQRTIVRTFEDRDFRPKQRGRASAERAIA